MECAEGETRRQVGPAGVDLFENGPQLTSGDAFEHIAHRPGLHCGHEVILVLGAGEHDEARVWTSRR